MTSVVSGRQSPVRRVSGSGSGAPRHLFVDNVRFWSMFAVVAIHACQVFGEVGGDQPGLVAIIMTPLKFGTIAFFLIAGFLAARGIEASPPGEYLSRRIKRVFFPWLVWMSLFVAWLMASDVVHHSISLSLSPATLFALAGLTRLCLFDTSFWFVPNLLLCLALLLAFRRYLDRLIFGALLLAFSLFYAVNIYKNWIPSSHSEALLGYVFYLWLGTYAARHQLKLNRWIARRSFASLVAAFVFTALLAYGEALFLDHRRAGGALNTLKVTNQLFSVVATLLLYKLSTATWPAFINVRDHTFGIYLTHPFILRAMMHLLNTSPLRPMTHVLISTHVRSFFLWAMVATVAYFTAFAVAKWLAESPLSWTVGVFLPEHANAPASAHASA